MSRNKLLIALAILGSVVFGAGALYGAQRFNLLPQSASAAPAIASKPVPTQTISNACMEEVRQIRASVNQLAESLKAKQKAAAAK